MQTGTVRPNKRIDSLTSLRGYLALWVVLYHFWNDILIFFPSLEILSPIVGNGQMAVPGFFMLSGFVLALNYGESFRDFSLKSIGAFLLLRLARIYPVHFVTLLTVLAMVLIGRHRGYSITDTGYSSADFFLNLILAQTWVPYFQLNWNYPSWSISSEWFIYILFPMIALFIFPHLRSVRAALVMALLSLSLGIFWMLQRETVLFYEMFLVVPLFILGADISYLIRWTPWSFGRSGPWGVDLFKLGVLGSLGLILAAGFLREVFNVSAILLGFSGLIFILSLYSDRPSIFWGSGVSLFLGDVSYSLYMTHTLSQKVLYKLLPSSHFLTADLTTRSGVFLIYVVVISIFCGVIYYGIEKPSLKYFRKKIPNISARIT